jgi:hypothetical protein
MGKISSTHRENKNAYSVSVGKPEGKRPLGTCVWMDLREIEWGRLIRTGLIWIRVRNSGGLL